MSDQRAAGSFTVSVVTPSLGYATYIKDAIESVRCQPPGLATEHVIVDGGSTDGTVDILKSCTEHVRWISEPDRGQPDAMNKGLELSSGGWIGWLNADEFYLPGALHRLVAHGEHTKADIIYGDAVFIDERGRFLRLRAEHPFRAGPLRRYGPFIQTVSALYRRRALIDAGSFDIDLKGTIDWGLSLALVRSGATFAYLAEPMGAFRIHPAMITALPREKVQAHLDAFRRTYGAHSRAHLYGGTGLGLWWHRWLKLRRGSYVRQWRAQRACRDRDMRWFATEAGRAGCDALFNLAYGTTSAPVAHDKEEDPDAR